VRSNYKYQQPVIAAGVVIKVTNEQLVLELLGYVVTLHHQKGDDAL